MAVFILLMSLKNSVFNFTVFVLHFTHEKEKGLHINLHREEHEVFEMQAEKKGRQWTALLYTNLQAQPLV